MPDRKRLFHLKTLPHAALALAAFGATGAMAQTGNIANGGMLYTTRVSFPVSGLLNCVDCHGPPDLFASSRLSGQSEATILGRINGQLGTAGSPGTMYPYSSWTVQQRTDVAAYLSAGAPGAPPPPPLGGGTPGQLAPPSASPAQVSFPSTLVGSTSSTTILMTNSSTTAVTFANPTLTSSGPNSAEFLNTAPPAGMAACPTTGGTLAAGMSCSFGVDFKPAAVGFRSATWTVNFTGNVAPRVIGLQANSMAPPPPPPAPAPSGSSANSPGGGGAIDALGIGALIGLLGLAGLRRRNPTS